jgi:hypothetical protein
MSEKCIKCKVNPIITKIIYGNINTENLCIVCLKSIFKDELKKQKCYHCDICKEARKYLQETNKDYDLSYEKNCFTGDLCEVWTCKICNFSLWFEMLMPGGSRYQIHEKARRDHINGKNHKCKWER